MIHPSLIGSFAVASLLMCAGCGSDLDSDLRFGQGGAGGSNIVIVPSGNTGSSVGAGGADGFGGSSVVASTASSSTGSDEASSGSGSTTCAASEHLCGGGCAPNTPETGCFKSATCSACGIPANGTSRCTPQGECDYDCTAPYVKDGSGGCVDLSASTSSSASGGSDDATCQLLCAFDPASAAGLGCAC